MKHIVKCGSCNIYTLNSVCPQCNNKTERPIPAKFSPIDKFAKYRRTVKTDMYHEKGYL